jgi:hypothetical protein
MPAWYAKLPVFQGKKVLAIDNNTIGAYLFESPNPDVKFAFEEPGLRIQCSRRVIDEALNHPGFQVARRQEAWMRLGELQAMGKVFLSGTSQMTEGQLRAYKELTELLQKAMVQEKDAPIAADAIVKRIPLLTIDQKFKNAVTGALNNSAVRTFLKQNSLPNTAALIFVP